MKKQRTVTQTEFRREYAPDGKTFKMIKAGETSTTYQYETNEADDAITINGKTYRIEYSSEWAYKIMKTKIKAPGAARLLDTLTEFQGSTQDYIEQRIIENCKPIKI